jgi:hypothetical protein
MRAVRFLLAAVVCVAAVAAIAAYSVDDAAGDHMTEAIQKDKAGDLPGALRSFVAAVRFHPDSFRHQHNLGVAFMRFGHTTRTDVRALAAAACLSASLSRRRRCCYCCGGGEPTCAAKSARASHRASMRRTRALSPRLS